MEDTGQIEFSHKPFSMPQGGLDALERLDPLDILAHQYEHRLQRVELASGAIRNHRPEFMYKAFAIAGYRRKRRKSRFAGYGSTPSNTDAANGGWRPVSTDS